MDRGDAVARFTHEVPSLDSYWRAIVLLGQNVASYKFALAGALLEIGAGSEVVSLDELALPFASQVPLSISANTTSREPSRRAASSMPAAPLTPANWMLTACAPRP